MRPRRFGIDVATNPAVTSSRLLLIALFGSLAALSIGCNQTRDLSAVSRTQLTAAQIAATPVPQPAQPQAAAPAAQPQYVAPASAAAATPPAPAAPRGEQTIDTNVPNPAAPPAPAAPIANNNSQPMFETKNLKSKVRTPQDEHLPKWVPVKGRLTVVDSSDLAENLGLVPKGTTKKSDDRISVADKLAEQDAARAAAKVGGDSMTQGSSWSYAKAGKVTNRR
jgi:hypothetical protein